MAAGGYGLGTAWDAFGDGTRNPASTTYTVTTAGHVGWVLLEARKNDADGGALNGAIDALLAMPRLDQGAAWRTRTRGTTGRNPVSTTCPTGRRRSWCRLGHCPPTAPARSMP
ncbi:MAG: hypothetical protein IPK24_10920 [Kineosporiaceae bacterium]|nr:hypothetical protein [Kineosporiaceae bacterium]